MAPGKTHLMRWAPQDWRTSRVRMRSAMTGDRDLRLVYFEALNALHENGGRVPSDPVKLADLLLIPADVIAAKLPVLLELGEDCDGGLVDNGDGTISNRRIVNDLADELAFREQQRSLGLRSAESRRSRANAQPSPSQRSANAQPRLNPPAPLPTPAPAPPPAPLARPVAAAPQRLTDSRPANPLVAGRRIDLEREFLALVGEIAKLTDRDPLEVAREATGYEGARTTPVNPASMSDDRLANSVMDLRSNLKAAKNRAEIQARGIREAR